MTRPTTLRHESGPAQRKSTLFCLTCDHASPIDGDWKFDVQETAVEYVCPVCGTTITERPRRDGDSSRADPVDAWMDVAHRSITVWRATVDAGLLSASALARQCPP